MEEFQTIEKAYELFKNANCAGNENCIFVAFRDTSRGGVQAGIAGGIGGAVGAIVANAVAKSMVSHDAFTNLLYDGFLINKTEAGIGLIPLNNDGVMWLASTEKLRANTNLSFFIKNEEIESVKIKNLALLNSKIKSIKITFTDGFKLRLIVRMKDKFISYTESNFPSFMQSYSN